MDVPNLVIPAYVDAQSTVELNYDLETMRPLGNQRVEYRIVDVFQHINQQKYLLSNPRTDRAGSRAYVELVIVPVLNSILATLQVRNRLPPTVRKSMGFGQPPQDYSIYYVLYQKLIKLLRRYYKPDRMTQEGSMPQGTWIRTGAWSATLQEFNQRVEEFNQVYRAFEAANPDFMQCKMCSNVAKFKCGSCMEAQYCGKPCQVEDWEGGKHKFEC